MPPLTDLEVSITLRAPRGFDPEAFLAADPSIRADRIQFVDELDPDANAAFPVAIDVPLGTSPDYDAAMRAIADWIGAHEATLDRAVRAGAQVLLCLPFQLEDAELLAAAHGAHVRDRWSALHLNLSLTVTLADDEDDEDGDDLDDAFDAFDDGAEDFGREDDQDDGEGPLKV